LKTRAFFTVWTSRGEDADPGVHRYVIHFINDWWKIAWERGTDAGRRRRQERVLGGYGLCGGKIKKKPLSEGRPSHKSDRGPVQEGWQKVAGRTDIRKEGFGNRCDSDLDYALHRGYWDTGKANQKVPALRLAWSATVSAQRYAKPMSAHLDG